MIIHGSTGADRAGGSVGVKEYLLESLQHLDTISEDSVGEEEGVEEVNGEEPEICQPLKQSLGSSVAYLWNLAVVETPTKSRDENIFGCDSSPGSPNVRPSVCLSICTSQLQ